MIKLLLSLALVLSFMPQYFSFPILLQVISFLDWQRIDAAEVGQGQNIGKPREKFVDIDKMLEAGKLASTC